MVSPRLLTSQRASATYPRLAASDGTGSGQVSLGGGGAAHAPEPSRLKPFLAGSVPVMMLVPLLVADFQVPKTVLGEIAVPPHCQSWQRVGVGSPGVQMTPGSAVMSVRKSEGKKG